MKQTILIAAVLISLLAVVGCAGEGAGEDSSAGKRNQFLSLGTAPPGGAFFVVGGAISEVLNESRGDNPWEVTAESTRGSQENIRRLGAGQIDLALANSAISYFAVRGERGWDKAYPIRTVMTLAPNVALFVTQGGSSVKTIADLKGNRVVVGPEGAGFEYFIEPMLEAHGVTYADFTQLHGGQAAAVDMLADGSARAAFLGGAVPTASITQACAAQDCFFVPFDPSAVERLTAEYLFFNPASIPAGTYRGQDEAYAGLDVGSMHLIASAATSDDLIYELTKTIYENREKVVAKHAAGRAINEKNVTRDTGTEFHPGAIRFYKEIGIWSGD